MLKTMIKQRLTFSFVVVSIFPKLETTRTDYFLTINGRR